MSRNTFGREANPSTNAMGGPMRPQPRRGASGPWNRLKPMVIDPLDVYGLPSKGEMRYVSSLATALFRTTHILFEGYTTTKSKKATTPRSWSDT